MAQFYDAWFDRCFAMAKKVSRRDESFCLDVVQEAMLRVVRSIPALETEAAVGAWMKKAVFSVIADRLRQDDRRQRRELRAVEGGSHQVVEEPLDQLEESERHTWLRSQLESLPKEDRVLILERFSGDKTLAAVGETVGMTGHAAHGRIRRVLMRLRDRAQEFFDE